MHWLCSWTLNADWPHSDWAWLIWWAKTPPRAKVCQSQDVLFSQTVFVHYGGLQCSPPPFSPSQGSGGAQQGPLSSWADLIPSDWELAGRWSVMVLPRRMINSMFPSSLAWVVILSLCWRRCYTEGPDKAVIEWTRMHAVTHPAAHMSAGLGAQVPFILSWPGLQNICCKFISLTSPSISTPLLHKITRVSGMMRCTMLAMLFQP